MIDYKMLAAEHTVTSATWDTFVRAALVDVWVAGYEAATDWRTEILEIEQGSFRTHCFGLACIAIGGTSSRTQLAGERI